MNRADLIELFKMIKGLSSTPWSHFFQEGRRHFNQRTYLEIGEVKKHNRCDTRLYFFSQRVINRWNNLSQEDVDSQSVICFKGRLEK